MVTKKTLFQWVKESDMKIQALIVVIIVLMVGARVFPMEMQKRIVNEAIKLQKVHLLMIYCGLFIASVILASGLKYVTNVLQTYMAEKTVARMRKELYAHILTLPLSFFRKTSPGMVIAALVQELAPAGQFVGVAISLPLTNILTLLGFAGYMFYLNPLLALLSFALTPLLMIILPMMQRKVNRFNKKRVEGARVLSSKINETISGIHEVQGNGSYTIENRKYGKLVDKLLTYRITWTLYIQGVKVLNNLFQNMGPFLLFLVGGYLAIKGRFDLGALVAFLSAYEKIQDPWKEFMEFYQVFQDASVRYKKTMELFDVEPEFMIEPAEPRPALPFKGDIEVKQLVFEVPGNIRLLKDINMELGQGEHMALVGFSGSGKSTLALCIGQLYKYTSGQVLIDGREVADTPKSDLVSSMGYVAQAPFIFDGTIEENLLYSCEAVLPKDFKGDRAEALPSLDRMIEVLQQVGIFQDVMRFGLNAIIDVETEPELVEKFIAVRKVFQEEHGEDLADNLEFFDEDKYLYFSTVAANLCFGNPNQEEFLPENLPDNQYFLDFLDEAQLGKPLLNLGVDLARQTVDILGGLPPDYVFFEQSPIASDQLEEYKELIAKTEKKKLHEFAKQERDKFLRLGLAFVPGKHKMAALPDFLERMILDARSQFKDKIMAEKPDAFTFYRKSEYIATQSILDNILFGKAKTEQPHVQDRINQAIMLILIQEDLLERVAQIGMQFQVGTKGDRLSGGQKQKLAIGRSFIKEPPILIMDEATSALDNRSQSRIQNLIESKWKGRSTLIAVIHRLDTIKNFDKIAVMKAGKIVEVGKYDELMAKKGMLHELVHGTKA